MISRWQLTVSESLDMGGRDYMEDFICNHIEKVNGKTLFGIFGIFDGHGGSEASQFVKNNLVNALKQNDKFWSNDESVVLTSIKEVYSGIQNLLWIEREKWSQTMKGYKSTAGTTATIAVIRNDTVFIGHVGDSGLVLASHNGVNCLAGEQITQEHSPNATKEAQRIAKCGGTVQTKFGITRIVWNRRKLTSKLEIDPIPFLAVARSLGDLWSYDATTNNYHVSPEPDVLVIKLDHTKHRALILASDGLWNVVNAAKSVEILNICENMEKISGENTINQAEMLVNYSISQWQKRNMRSDNLSVLVIKLLPEGFCKEECNIDDEEEMLGLQQEILDKRLVPNCTVNQEVVTLDKIDNFEEYANSNKKIMLTDLELLKSFILSSEKYAKSCIAWRNDNAYWEKLKTAFDCIGLRQFPSLVSHFDSLSSSSSLEDYLNSFSWSITCLKCVDEFNLTSRYINQFKSQPLLSQFWIDFYQKIISPNICFTIDKLTQPSMYHMLMSHIVQHKQPEIRGFIDSKMAQQQQQQQSPFGLTKSLSCTNNPPTVFTCVRLKRSASFEVTLLPAIDGKFSTSSNCSTPLLSPVRVTTTPMRSSSIEKMFHKPMLLKTRSLKINISKNVSRLSCKRGRTESEKHLVRYVPRKKLKSQ